MIKFYAFIKSAVWIPAFAGMTKLQLVKTVQFMRIAKNDAVIPAKAGIYRVIIVCCSLNCLVAN